MEGEYETHLQYDQSHEDLVVGGLFGWITAPALKSVEDYLETVRKYPNPPPPNITQFKNGGG